MQAQNRLALSIALFSMAISAPTPKVHGQTSSLPDGRLQVVAEKMCCAGCARKVSSQIYTVRGVRSVSVDLATHTVSIEHGQLSAPVLGQIWNAVQVADGGPVTMTTGEATYRLTVPEDPKAIEAHRRMGKSQQISFVELKDPQQAQLVASKLQEITGVAKVSVDMPSQTITVDVADKPISPWSMLQVIRAAGATPAAFLGNYGTLAIEPTAPAVSNVSQPKQPLR
ncbi:cation transporter [Aeoliella sp. SH292]|uniref:cation transporter n=1 Tax=Aeoliella sp. SH292 TaxID=3454464 RepID=UPI003F9BE245